MGWVGILIAIMVALALIFAAFMASVLDANPDGRGSCTVMPILMPVGKVIVPLPITFCGSE